MHATMHDTKQGAPLVCIGGMLVSKGSQYIGQSRPKKFTHHKVSITSDSTKSSSKDTGWL